MKIALSGGPRPNRYVGAWLQSEVVLHRRSWPKHEMLEPTAFTMNLIAQKKSFSSSFKPIFWVKVIGAPIYLFKMFLSPHLRDALSRLFLASEKSGRYLQPSWIKVNSDDQIRGTTRQLTLSPQCSHLFFRPRTQKQSNAIYRHGMNFLRGHRILTSLSQRQGSISPSKSWKIKPKPCMQEQSHVVAGYAQNACNLT